MGFVADLDVISVFMKTRRLFNRLHRLLLPLESDLGSEFVEEMNRGALRGLRVACWMAVLSGVAFGLIDLLFLFPQSHQLLRIGPFGVLALGLGGALVSYSSWGRERPRGLSVVIAMGIGSCLIANLLAAGSHALGFFSGLNTILLLMAALGTLKPLWVLVTSIYFLAAHAWAGLRFDPTVGWPPAASFVLHNTSLLVTGILSMLLAAVLHRSRRTEFTLRKQLAEAFTNLQQTQARLLVSEKAAAQGQVVAALSHELNSPLAVVVGNLSTQQALSLRVRASVAEPSHLPAELSKLLAISQELNTGSLAAAKRMTGLLERLRQFTHLDEASTQTANLNRELLHALDMVQAEVGIAANVETHLNPLPDVLCQPQRIGMVFCSLLRNAFQSLNHDGCIRISTKHADGQVEIRIEDNGRGINPTELKGVFDPRFVFQGGTVRTSWGLLTSQQIIVQHGGQIELESKPGLGTTARVLLPIRGVQAQVAIN
jgi:signal transduction histidine kinase